MLVKSQAGLSDRCIHDSRTQSDAPGLLTTDVVSQAFAEQPLDFFSILDTSHCMKRLLPFLAYSSRSFRSLPLAPASFCSTMSKVQVKTPKGTQDWDGVDILIRDRIFDKIKDVFKRHNAEALDTPVFELKEVLTGKYGEDSKLIYDLADQGGELSSLRYDLTVPFARYLAQNGLKEKRRYQISKVYRRDQPAMTKGRKREFYQCDFDIAGGNSDSMLPDARILRITCEIFNSLGWKDNYTIKINNRKILDGLFQVCGVPEQKIRTISSAVDKLDKSPWTEVRREMTEEKGLDGEVADRIGEYVVLKGGRDLLEKLQKDEKLSKNESAKAGLEDMEKLFGFLKAFKVLDRVSFDMSLARGLDYYTGVIYEVVTEGSAPPATSGDAKPKKPKKKSADADEDRSDDPTVGVGSVAAGGRYDGLVSMFSGKQQIPCVGISFGVDRIFSIIKQRLGDMNQVRKSEIDVYVMVFGSNGLLDERIDVATRLWDAGISADFMEKAKPKVPQQFKKIDEADIPFSVILGEDEFKQGKCKIKRNGLPEGHAEKEGVLIDLEKMEEEVKLRLDEYHAERKLQGLFI